jgi:hypothetical protein
MAEIIARFADGRLLVQENRAVESNYAASGIKFRVGHLRVIEKVLSLEAFVSGAYGAQGGLYTSLGEAQKLVSGDTIVLMLRRGDIPTMLSGFASGLNAYGVLSSITSGVGYKAELLSGAPISGLVRVLTNVIGI